MPSTTPRTVLAVAAVAVLAAGCAGGEPSGPGDAQDGASPAAPSPAATSAVPADILQEAAAMAAERAGVAPQDVQVLRADEVQWPSGALGCPEEGQMYAQVVTDGYWMVLRAGDEELDLRSADTGPVRLCETGGEPPMGSSPG